MSEPPPPLVVEALGHAYGHRTVLRDLDLELAAGEVLAVVGPSGCGKTTLLRAVAGLLTPDAGAVRIGGREVARGGRELVPTEARRVGLVFQDYALFAHMSVRDNVAFALPRAERPRAEALMAQARLDGLADRLPGELSGGQQQRVALARALAPRPHLLLLDEPFANVDAPLRRHLAAEVQTLLRAEGTSALLVTHDRDDAMAVADRLAVLLPGPGGARLAQCEAPERVYRRPADARVARLLGPAALLEGDARGAAVDTPLGPAELLAPRQGRVVVVARPEQLAFAADPGGDAEVVASTFVGRGYRVTCRAPLGEVEADVVPGPRPAPGTRGRLRLEGPCWALP